MQESVSDYIPQPNALAKMTFPLKPRVIYGTNPLKEVVCQLRFPRLFLLDERVPSEFQRNLGTGYPHIETREVASFAFGGLEAATAPISRRVIYDFISTDRTYVVSISSEFLALRAERYTKWEDFFAHLRTAADALFASYTIPNFSRLGLRYINFIDKVGLGLAEEKWSDLIRGSALGLIGDSDLEAESVLEGSSSTLLRLEKGAVALNCGLLREQDQPQKYVIDCDFFYDQPIENPDDAYSLLADYNHAARNAFRWFIKDQLHDALGPSRV